MGNLQDFFLYFFFWENTGKGKASNASSSEPQTNNGMAMCVMKNVFRFQVTGLGSSPGEDLMREEMRYVHL